MKVVADLHLHSKYSRAVSQQMILSEMAKWAKRKGIDLLGTGDFTHPLWFRELKSQLEEDSTGIYKLKTPSPPTEDIRFLLSTEISSIYSQGGRLRRIHNVVFAPSLETVEKINQALLQRGANLMSDGRPIIGLPARDLAKLVLGVDQNCLVVPAHVWTPWFSLYGSESGFDSINECFGDMAKNIYAVETGLSSNPGMNWRIAELESRQIVSFSDAHSGPKLGREATVFEIPQDKQLSHQVIRQAIQQPVLSVGESSNGAMKQFPHISHTLEFYPEEGKYHFTGHRNCNIRQSPEETKSKGSACPVCGKGLTVGVMHRVEQLARPTNNLEQKTENDGFGVKWIEDSDGKRPPYAMLVPLLEIIAEALGSLPASQKVLNEYNNLTDRLGSEFKVLLETPVEEIAKVAGEKISEGVKKVRTGDIKVDPGYDGVFGKVKIWSPDAGLTESKEEKKDQLSLF